MKKSEMIDFIEWFLNDQLVCDEKYEYIIVRDSAEDLLGHILEMGMLPPQTKSTWIEKFKGEAELPRSYFENRWEEEDK